MLIRGGGGGYIEGVTSVALHSKLKMSECVGLLHLNRIFRTFGAGWRGKLDIFDTLKK